MVVLFKCENRQLECRRWPALQGSSLIKNYHLMKNHLSGRGDFKYVAWGDDDDCSVWGYISYEVCLCENKHNWCPINKWQHNCINWKRLKICKKQRGLWVNLDYALQQGEMVQKRKGMCLLHWGKLPVPDVHAHHFFPWSNSSRSNLVPPGSAARLTSVLKLYSRTEIPGPGSLLVLHIYILDAAAGNITGGD